MELRNNETAAKDGQLPLVSVIIPIYRTETYLRECVDSVLGQSYGNLQIILVDDGSDDGAPGICDGYAVSEGRVQVIHQENQGLSVARNVGIESALGEYLAFVDSDDSIGRDMIRDLLALLVETSAKIAVCNYTLVDDKEMWENPAPKPLGAAGVMESGSFYPYLLDKHGFECYAWNRLYHRSLFHHPYNLRFKPEFTLCEDRHFTLSAMKVIDRIAYSKTSYVYYRIHHDSLTSLAQRDHGVASLQARKEAISCLPLQYASYDKAIYLTTLSFAILNAFEQGDKGEYTRLCRELQEIKTDYSVCVRENRHRLSWNSRVLSRCLLIHCGLGCRLISALRQMRNRFRYVFV